tara:strand:+ start:1691 stop:2194 length:504 start_codon:yes stop_codon:yes gene_type:complete
MAILHYRITQANQPINLSRTLHAQNLTLRRVSVIRNISIPSNIPGSPTLVPATQYYIPEYLDPKDDLHGGIIVDVSFFKGFEVLSNFSSNDLMIPFSNDDTVVDSRYEQNFSNEDISLSFSVKVFNYLREPNVKFTSDTGNSDLTPGAIKYIDMFFEFDELFNYNTY